MNLLCEEIKKQRKKLGLTKKELSKLSNVSYNIINNIENKKNKNIKSIYLYRLANALKIEYEYLLKVSGKEIILDKVRKKYGNFFFK